MEINSLLSQRESDSWIVEGRTNLEKPFHCQAAAVEKGDESPRKPWRGPVKVARATATKLLQNPRRQRSLGKTKILLVSGSKRQRAGLVACTEM